MVSTNENAFTRSNQGAISRQKQFVLSRVILLKATARILYPRIYILSTIKLYYFYNRVFDTAQADYSRRETVFRP